MGDRVGRRSQPLTSDQVGDLPAPCSSCIAWELGGGCPSPRTSSGAVPGGGAAEPPDRTRQRKRDWVAQRIADGIPPGRVVRDEDGEVIAYALYAPAGAFTPRRFPVPDSDRDTILLATIWVAADRRGHGVGRWLLRAAVKDAIQAGAPAVEAYGDRRWVERSCVLPATWLLHEGFEVHREHPRNPLLRLEVRRTVRWAEPLEHALEELIAALPRRVPAPRREPRLAPGGVPEVPRMVPDRSLRDRVAPVPTHPGADLPGVDPDR